MEDKQDGAPGSLRDGPDSIFRTADVVGDAWSWLVMREAILFRITRFNEFRTRLGISRSTLSARLTQLTKGGLLTRRAPGSTTGRPSRGKILSCLLVSMRWGDRWYFESDAVPNRLPISVVANPWRPSSDATPVVTSCGQAT